MNEDDREGSDPEQVGVECTCPLFNDTKKSCGVVLDLMVMIPEVSLGGVYQISTRSVLNRQRVDDYLEYLKSLVGRIDRLPLKLSREEVKTTYINKEDKRVTSTHHLLKFDFLGNALDLKRAIEDKNSLSTSNLLIASPSEEGYEIEHSDVTDLEQESEVEVKDFFQMFSDIRARCVLADKVDEFNQTCKESFGSLNPNDIKEGDRSKIIDRLLATL